MQARGLDGMRYLGSVPGRPASYVERLVMVMLHNEIGSEVGGDG